MGESVAREFVVTSVMPGDHKLMVTVVDPCAVHTIEPDFRGRHEELVKHVDFEFIDGDLPPRRHPC